MRINQTWETVTTTDEEEGTSPRLFNESEEDLLEGALVVSERAGHDEAPMTGPTSEEAPLDGLFQTGFFPAFPWAPPDSSDLSSPATGAGGGATDAEGIGSLRWGEEGAAEEEIVRGSDSPRTIWLHGEGRRDCAGLPRFSLVEEAAEAIINGAKIRVW